MRIRERTAAKDLVPETAGPEPKDQSIPFQCGTQPQPAADEQARRNRPARSNRLSAKFVSARAEPDAAPGGTVIWRARRPAPRAVPARSSATTMYPEKSTPPMLAAGISPGANRW